MTSLHETKLIWLQRFLEVNNGKLTWHDAERIIHKLDYIEMEYEIEFSREPEPPDTREFIDY